MRQAFCPTIRYLLGWVIPCAFVAPPLAAQVDERAEAGARESCRQEVAGRYLTAINDFDMAIGTLKASRSALTKTLKARGVATKRLAAAQAQYRKSPSDFDLKHKVDSAYHILDQLDQQVTSLEATIVAQKDVQKKARATKAEVLAAIKGVFRVTHDPKNPYGTAMAYKSSCGRFRYICPPTAEETAAIRRVFAQQPMPVDCQKFLGQLKR